MPRRLAALGAAALAAAGTLAPRPAAGEVVRVEVVRRTPIGGGVAFGAAGAYERIEGRLHYAWDPTRPANRRVVDLARAAHASRDARGRVTAWSEFVLLRPVDPARASGVTLVDVVNRGGMTTGVFHLGARRDLPPDSALHYGDALLLRRGMAVLMVGWQWDILPGAGPLHFHPPVACAGVGRASRRPSPGATDGRPTRGTPTDGAPTDSAGTPCARPLTGLVRSDITVDAPTAVIPLGHRVGGSQALGYPVADPDDPSATLTVRDTPRGPRELVPRARWRFARPDSSGRPVPDRRHVWLDGGFAAGRIYEVVYRAQDPVIVGTGLLAVRDAIAWLKHDRSSLAPTRWGIAYGVSQTGRLLRHLLWEGLHVDEQGRLAYDGILAHTAGAGRGSFNHRFAQPSRDAQPYSTFDYPTDLFPFTGPSVRDPVTGARGGLRTRSAQRARDGAEPRVFYVDGGYEYWGRAASLTHTTPDGRRDVPLLAGERRYFLASAQHSGPAGFPPPDGARLDGGPAWRGDPLDQRLALRALLVALERWVTAGEAPPASRYPTLADSLLVTPAALRRPTIPGVRLALVPHAPARLDLGPLWSAGLVDREPPCVGAPYTVLVPQVDSLGNDRGGIQSIELRVPLATYLPWQLRAPGLAGSDRLTSFAGTFVPLPRDEAARRAAGDPRPSLAALHGGRDAFLAAVERAAAGLVAERFLLPDDVPAARARMAATWDWIVAR